MSATVHIDTSGAGQVAGRFGAWRTRLQRVVREAPHEAAGAAVPAYQAVAPVRSGQLKARTHAEGAEVITDPVNRRDGFHYAGVTRFGHRFAVPDRIFPTKGRALGPMLGGRFFSSVARYHPASDWARRGDDQAQRLAGERFGRMVDDALR